MPAIKSIYRSKKPKKWSKYWKSSKNPAKQRKYQKNAPLHIKRKFLSAHLSKDLRKKYSIRSIPLRKGDVVIVLRGNYKGKKAEVERIDVSKTKVYLKGIKIKRADGTEINVPFHPSNLMIVELNLNDKKRAEKLNNKTSQVKQ